MMYRLLRIISLMALLGAAAPALGAAAKEPLLPGIAWQQTKDLPVESLGKPLGVPWMKALPLMALPDGKGWMQPFWYRAHGRQVYFCSLNLQTGDVKLHRFPAVGGQAGGECDFLPAYEIWRPFSYGGKLYLGYNVPSFLVIYDPTDDSTAFLGRIFHKAITVYSVSGGADGAIVFGGANGSTEVAHYDPRSGKLTCYDALSEKHGYVYTIAQDADFIYGACRGSLPWGLVALNKKTGAKKVILEAPVDAYMNVGDAAQIMEKRKDPQTGKQETVYRRYRLHDGQATEIAKPPAAKPQPPAPPAPPAPEVMFDPATVYSEGKLTIYYRLPADKPAKDNPDADAAANGWKTAKVAMDTEPKGITRLLAWDDKTVIGASGAYGPMFRYDIDKDETKILGPNSGNAYSICRAGDRVYASGYPSTWLDEIDPSQPFTPMASVPGRPAVASTSPKANPRLVTYFSNVKEMHSHCGVRLHVGPDGKVWVVGMKFRYYRGFALGWYDPKTGKFDKFDDGGLLNHLQVSWSCTIDDGRRIAISTRVQPNNQVTGAAPAAAKIFIFDMAEGRFVKEYTPFPDEKALLTLAQVKDGTLVGLITEERYPQQSRTLIYKFDLAAGKVVRTRAYGDVIAGVSTKMGIPREGPDYRTGPDGFVWTLYRLGSLTGYPWLLLRIDPQELTVSPIGRVGSGGRFFFLGRDLYLAGEGRLRRVKDVAPEP